MAQGRFRSDLYFALGGVALEVPPLRERKEDLVTLSKYFLAKYARELGRVPEPPLTSEAIKLLCQHDWPGNLTELSSTMRRSIPLGSVETALTELLSAPAAASARRKESGPLNATPKPGLNQLAREAAQRVEREIILQALREGQWNRKRAALALNVGYKTLLSKIKQLGLAYER